MPDDPVVEVRRPRGHRALVGVVLVLLVQVLPVVAQAVHDGASAETLSGPRPVEAVLGPVEKAVTVPDVVGLDVQDAQVLLDSEGLGYFDRQETDPSVPSGIVSQTPAPGLLVRPGTVVSVTVAPLVAVPNLLKDNEATARQAILDAGLIVSRFVGDLNGLAFRQSPQAGQAVPRGSKVIVGFLPAAIQSTTASTGPTTRITPTGRPSIRSTGQIIGRFGRGGPTLSPSSPISSGTPVPTKPALVSSPLSDITGIGWKVLLAVVVLVGTLGVAQLRGKRTRGRAWASRHIAASRGGELPMLRLREEKNHVRVGMSVGGSSPATTDVHTLTIGVDPYADPGHQQIKDVPDDH